MNFPCDFLKIATTTAATGVDATDTDTNNNFTVLRWNSQQQVLDQGMIDKFWLGLTFVVGLTWGAPNIVMITVEDLGWGDVSWNNPEVIMPNIATLASSGVILGHIIFSSRHEKRQFLFADAAYVQPSSGSSQASLLTGKYPSR